MGIAKCFNDPAWTVKVAALEAIGSCGELGQMYAADVCRLMFDDLHPVRIAAINCLRKMDERGAAFTEEVASLLDDPIPEIRVACLGALGQWSATEYVPQMQALEDIDPS